MFSTIKQGYDLKESELEIVPVFTKQRTMKT
jgi:hypothetical protein